MTKFPSAFHLIFTKSEAKTALPSPKERQCTLFQNPLLPTLSRSGAAMVRPRQNRVFADILFRLQGFRRRRTGLFSFTVRPRLGQCAEPLPYCTDGTGCMLQFTFGLHVLQISAADHTEAVSCDDLLSAIRTFHSTHLLPVAEPPGSGYFQCTTAADKSQ